MAAFRIQHPSLRRLHHLAQLRHTLPSPPAPRPRSRSNLAGHMWNTEAHAYPLVAARDMGADLHATRRIVVLGYTGATIHAAPPGEPTRTTPKFAGMKGAVEDSRGRRGYDGRLMVRGRKGRRAQRLPVSCLRVTALLRKDSKVRVMPQNTGGVLTLVQ